MAYASRSLNPHEKNYTISELETLALVWVVKQVRAYILGHKCIVLTDHSACTSLLNTPHPSAKLARWAMIIQEMDLHIQHRPGNNNASANALSRNPVERFNCTLSHMISKCAQKNGSDWDKHFPFLLFAYCATIQESTQELPFYLLYGRDLRLPTESVLNHYKSLNIIDVDDYKTAMVLALSEAWKQHNITSKCSRERRKKFMTDIPKKCNIKSEIE